ncbi:MAG: hypothetical protein V7670_06470 [Maribacter arcticus]|uniref:hypothetical protein n=1 Tax=Maribacter arcticus TaxID=561365 RepID=UPI0030024828
MANNTGKKYGGREAGTPNKLTKELRVALKNIMFQEIELIPEHLKTLEPKDRLELTIKLMPYVYPKISSVSPSTNEPMTFGWDD